jgi:hypothetical protein
MTLVAQTVGMLAKNWAELQARPRMPGVTFFARTAVGRLVESGLVLTTDCRGLRSRAWRNW